MNLESGIKLIYSVVMRLLMMRAMLSLDVIHNPVEVMRVFSLSEIEYY